MHSKNDWVAWAERVAKDIRDHLVGERNDERCDTYISDHLNDELAVVMDGYDAVDVLTAFPDSEQVVDRTYEKQWTNPNGVKFPDHLETLIALAKEILATNVHRMVWAKIRRKKKTE